MTNGNESAYPFIEQTGNPECWDTTPGLTKRECFAAMAMQGYCGGESTGQSGMSFEYMAEWSVQMADALIEALNKTENK